MLLLRLDFTMGIIPDRLVYPATAAGFVLAAYGYGRVNSREALIGAIVGWCVPAVSVVFTRVGTSQRSVEGLGRGDWKLAAMIGAWLGTVPTLAAFASALCAHLTLAIFRGRARPTPFAPAFCLPAVFYLVSDLFGASL